MKAGDVCRCISNFNGISSEELTLYKNDIVQVHEVVDRHWVRGEGGGAVGQVPSSVLVKINEFPPHPPHQPLFVASAEFMPSQPGDLGLSRGDFVVGLNPIDESWWCGEKWGKQGIFPINFVWQINKDIIQVEDTSEKEVRLQGRVKTSIKAQLPEELDLYAGDLVTITHIVDKDMYRGESNGATGIFPKNFVDIVSESSVPSPPVVKPKESSFMVSDTPSSLSLTGGTSCDLMSATSYDNGTSAHPHPADSVPSLLGGSSSSTHHSIGSAPPSDATLTSTSASQPVMDRTEPTVRLSNTSSAWKTIDAGDDDLFDDDYFRQNMPSLFSPKGGSGSVPPAHTNDTTSTLSPASGASMSLPMTGSRYENIPVSVHSEPSPVTLTSHCLSEGKPDKYRYENIQAEESYGPREDNDEVIGGPNLSAFLEEEKMNSLSQKVEDYLSSNLQEEGDTKPGMSSSTGRTSHAWACRGPSYTEDNTGIEPYGRAVFSFKAQYPNELTFKKGEIVHLLQHVDSHWTLGRAGDAKGIFPTSYVDIIVDCLHSEEQHFLTRPEAAPSASQPVQVVAQYDFQAVQVGDVSMKKGDTLTVLKEVDANWAIVENMTGSKGMCPKNYLSFLKDRESPGVQESQSQTPDSTPDTSEQRSRLSHQDSAHQRSRSSSPFSASWQRRSYNKDDFGSIKRQDVEPVLAKNIASLDAATKASVCQPEKKVSESVFVQREMSPAEEQEVEGQQSARRPKPMALPRQSKIPPEQTGAGTEIGNKFQEKADSIIKASSPPPITTTAPSTTVSATSAITASTNSAATSLTSSTTTATTAATASATSSRSGSFSSSRPAPPPLLPPRTKVFTRSNSLQSDSATASVLRPPPRPPQPLSQPDPKPCQTQQQPPSLPQPSSQTHSNESQPEPPTQTESSNESHLQSSSQPHLPSQPQSSSQPQPTPSSEPVYSQVKKPLRRSREKEDGKDSPSGTQHLNDSVNSTASFPDDLSRLSVASEAIYYSETSLGSSSSGLVPQRPAPPPPPKLPDIQDQEEQYYSLTPHEPEATESQAAEMTEAKTVEDGKDMDTEEVAEEGAPEPRRHHPSMRRVVVQEIVTTEHEYIHDLEALMQVIQLASSRPGGSQGVHLPSLMGNITEILVVAKKFARLLDQAAYGDNDEEVCVGKVFLACAEELCQTYKVYCANHNVTVEPLMKKYEQEPEPAAFLQWVLEELQQHKIQLLDMRSVLIKPLQRVLKYPLFLDRLVRETSEHHLDHKDLVEAKTAMANTAKEINEYTKRLDLVNKYRNESDQSLQSKMQRVSLHSVAKKSARISTLVSEMLGIMVQTKDPEFDEEVANFRSVQRWATAMSQDIEGLLQGLKARHRAELGVVKGLVDTLLHPGSDVEALHKVAADSVGRLFEMFDNIVRQRVILPTKQLVGLCEVPDRLILKRNDKLLDYDNAQYKVDRNRDPTRTRILEEELSQVQGTYSALNTQLMMELPVLTRCGIEVLSLATRSLISARMYLQGHLARLYLNLAQALGLALTGDVEDMLTQFRVKYLQQVGEFRQLSFLPADSLQWSLPRAKGRPRKSLDGGAAKREQTEAARTKVVGQYPGEMVYVVREVHTPAEVMELTLYPGDHVALLKNKDPLGRTDRWFVDDGDNKGFVRASCLKPMLGSEGGAGFVASNPPASAETAAMPIRPVAPSGSPRPSTLPRPAPAPPEQAPPRYEDIFPVEPSTLPHGPGYPQAPPPRYSSGETLSASSQLPLPSKTELLPPTGGELQLMGDGNYYSPPMDRQQSGEYTSPVSEENNIYEEIDQGAGEGRDEGGATGETDTSPIYEVIKDGEILKDPADLPPVPGEPQFYYALYNFGGSDATQLNLVAGQVVLVLHAVSSDWWFVEERSGKQGYVPASYLTRYS